MSTLQMLHPFRELQGLHGEPIDFDWKNFPGATALDLLHKFQKDLEGKCITPKNFSDRIISMSMFNDIDLDKKGNEDSCNTTSRNIKMYAQDSLKNTGHSWVLEKKASGIKDMQPIVAANGISVLHKW